VGALISYDMWVHKLFFNCLEFVKREVFFFFFFFFKFFYFGSCVWGKICGSFWGGYIYIFLNTSFLVELH
jgi:hypothetical protein